MMAVAQWALARPALYALPMALPSLRLGETVFRQPEPAQRMNEVSGKILGQTIRTIEPEAVIRRLNAARLSAIFPAGVTLPRGPVGRPGFLRLPFLLPPGLRIPANSPGARRMGIMPGYPRPLHTLPGPTAATRTLPGATHLAESLFTMPVHSRLNTRDLSALEAWITTTLS